MLELRFFKLRENAVLPQYAKAGDIGLDLCWVPKDLAKGERDHRWSVQGWGSEMMTDTFATGLAPVIPVGWGLLLKERSSHALKYGLHVIGGVIDQGYTGEILVILTGPRSGFAKAAFEPGERIAQAILIPKPEVGIGWTDIRPDTERGTTGFGSSGR